MEYVETINFILALGGVVLFITAVFLVVDLYTSRSAADYVTRWGLLGTFLVTLGSVLMSLYYSDVLGFVPCGLCWLQRTFLFPQMFLTGTALWLKDTRIAIYGIVLSVPGLLIGLYQHYLQLGGSELVGCPTAGAGADCAKRIMFEFGFMTFPLLSVATFAFLIALYWYLYKTT